MQKIFVYGTLMRGQQAHNRLEGAKYEGKAVLRDYRMFNLGAFPGIQYKEGGSVVGELYEVSDEMISKIDSYEGEGELYNREKVEVLTYNCTIDRKSPFVFPVICEAFVYIYNGEADQLDTISYEWGTDDNDYLWYAAYGSNIDEERFLCYIDGGRCAANGKYYNGCDDKTRWIDEDVALYPGTIYSANESSSWNNKGVAFYDEKCRDNMLKGFTFFKLYKIKRNQLEQVQRQEGRRADWYGRKVVVGIYTDNVPIYTFTSETRGKHNDPDRSYVEFIVKAIESECKKRGIGDFGRETGRILIGRNPQYEELTESEKQNKNPYRLLCTKCFNEAKNCTCRVDDPLSYRYYEEIDEGIFDVVAELNRKNYYTVFSCEGHLSDKPDKKGKIGCWDGYLVFAEPYIFPQYPPKHSKTTRDRRTFYWEGYGEESRQEFLSNVLEWARCLPSREKKRIVTYRLFARHKSQPNRDEKLLADTADYEEIRCMLSRADMEKYFDFRLDEYVRYE